MCITFPQICIEDGNVSPATHHLYSDSATVSLTPSSAVAKVGGVFASLFSSYTYSDHLFQLKRPQDEAIIHLATSKPAVISAPQRDVDHRFGRQQREKNASITRKQNGQRCREVHGGAEHRNVC